MKSCNRWCDICRMCHEMKSVCRAYVLVDKYWMEVRPGLTAI